MENIGLSYLPFSTGLCSPLSRTLCTLQGLRAVRVETGCADNAPGPKNADMSLTRLLIKDFRNIESADLALSPGFNFLVGANGSGKTSVLEAIYTLGHGRAFRSLQIGRVIRHEQDAFVLHGRLQGEERKPPSA